MLRNRQVTFFVLHVETMFPEMVSQSVPCLPDVDCPRAFKARNSINDVIRSAREMPGDLDLSSW